MPTRVGGPAGDYGPLGAIARHKVNLERIRAHWPDMLRVAGSLLTNTVRSYDLIRMLARDGHPVRNEDVARLSPLGHAHINVLGRYAFSPRTDRALRPLRDPDTVDE